MCVKTESKTFFKWIFLIKLSLSKTKNLSWKVLSLNMHYLHIAFLKLLFSLNWTLSYSDTIQKPSPKFPFSKNDPSQNSWPSPCQRALFCFLVMTFKVVRNSNDNLAHSEFNDRDFSFQWFWWEMKDYLTNHSLNSLTFNPERRISIH